MNLITLGNGKPLTLSEGLPVVEAAHEFLIVKGRTLLRSGVQRASCTHLEGRTSEISVKPI